MPKEHLQSVKVVLILCSSFFAYGSCWSDWAFDYYFLWANLAEHPNAIPKAIQYYTNQLEAPDIIKYIPFVNLMIAAVGFSAGIANMTDGNILFDGASLVLMLFALSTWATTVKPGVQSLAETKDIVENTKTLKNIAAAHFIMVLAITGIVGLQITHYILNKRADNAERAEEEAAAKARASKSAETKKSK